MESSIIKIRLLKDDERLKTCENNSAICIYTDDVKNAGIDIIEYIGSSRTKKNQVNKFLASKNIGKIIYSGNKSPITKHIGRYYYTDKKINHTITTTSDGLKKLIINLSKEGIYSIHVKKYINGSVDFRLEQYERIDRYNMKIIFSKKYSNYTNFDLKLE